MASLNSARDAAAEAANVLLNCPAGKSDNRLGDPDQVAAATVTARPPSKWRSRYKVHPAADVFSMMSDDELAKLGENIRAYYLKKLAKLDPGARDTELQKLAAMIKGAICIALSAASPLEPFLKKRPRRGQGH